MSSVKSRKRAHTHLTVCAHLVGENINKLVFRTMGHMGTGTRQLVRTLGERWPLRLDPRGSRGKSARGTKNPPHSMRGSVRPDSPRWLLRRHREDQARAVLQHIRARADVSEELAAIQHGLSVEQGGGWADLLSPAVKMPLLVGVGLALLQQVTGINTVIYYAPTIFEFAGFKSAEVSIAATAGVGVVNVVMTLVALWLVDRAGRRPLLLWGIAGMAISLLVLGAGFAFGRAGGGASGGWLGWLTAGSLMVYVGTFALGLGPVFWLLIAEIYPLTVRARAMSVATVANWGANLLVAVTFLTLTQVLGRAGTFWLYAVVALAAWVFAFRLVPETKGKTLEEIEAHWHAGKHPRELGRTPPGRADG